MANVRKRQDGESMKGEIQGDLFVFLSIVMWVYEKQAKD